MQEQAIVGIIGPSGCGKSSLVYELVRTNDFLELHPSYTDRPKRIDEVENDHVFITSDEFNQLQNNHAFLEVVQPFGLAYRYGLPAVTHTPDKIAVIMLRAAFVPLFKKHYKKGVVYQIEADFDFASKAMKNRNDENLGTRLSDFESEIQQGRHAADRIFKNGVDIALHDLQQQIQQALREDFTYILHL